VEAGLVEDEGLEEESFPALPLALLLRRAGAILCLWACGRSVVGLRGWWGVAPL